MVWCVLRFCFRCLGLTRKHIQKFTSRKFSQPKRSVTCNLTPALVPVCSKSTGYVKELVLMSCSLEYTFLHVCLFDMTLSKRSVGFETVWWCSHSMDAKLYRLLLKRISYKPVSPFTRSFKTIWFMSDLETETCDWLQTTWNEIRRLRKCLLSCYQPKLSMWQWSQVHYQVYCPVFVQY